MDAFEFRRRSDSRVDDRTESLAEALIGAAIEVHRWLGPGMPESSYRNALCHEFDLRGIPYEYEVPIDIMYNGKPVGQGRIDLLVGKALVVELKVVESLNDVHRAQLISYLRITKLQLGLLINFNVALLKDGIKRVVNTLAPT